MKKWRFSLNKLLIITFISLFLGVFPSTVYPLEDSGGALFIDADSDVDYISRIEHQVIRQRFVTVDFALLCPLETQSSLRKSQGKQQVSPILQLNLFADVNLSARIYQVEEVFSSGFSAVGNVEGIPGSEVILVVTGDILSANISVPDHFYQIRYVSEDKHKIQEIDQSQFSLELPPVSIDLPMADDTQDIPTLNISADNGSKIDVMVVYTAAARSGAGGTTAMNNLINLAVSETNTGYSNGGVTQRLRLVHTAEVDYSESGFNWSTTLSRLQGNGDGYMDDVHTWRNTYGADEVVLIVNNTASCGIGYVMQTVSSSFASYAFCVVSRTCATGYYSFAHEMGHNMGCAHDRDNASVTGAYNYSFGYQAPDEAFRTIMAYNCPGGCPRVNYWSNPDKQYGGQSMGVVYTDLLAADNRRSLNNTAYTVANFRQSTPTPTITVTSPNGGETLTSGSNHSITWTTTGTVGNVKIQYSTNNGSNWSTVTSSTANDGNYPWTVPDVNSTQCKIRISEASDGNPSDTSNSVFSIKTTSSSGITVTSPNGGESLKAGSSYTISWTTSGTVGNVKIQYSTNTGSSWSTITSSTANDGAYSWTVPNVNSSQCLVKISEASDNNPSDTSNSVFSIKMTSSSGITITSPNGGESLKAGSSHTISWTTSGTVGNVKIQYSTNNGSSWSTITSSTANDGAYSWTIPNANSSKCLAKISEASDSIPVDTSDAVFTIYSAIPPEISLSRTQFFFGADTSGTVTGSQTILIDNSGGETLEWNISSDQSWLNCTPASGINSGILSISVAPSGLDVGIYTGTITVSDANASNSPRSAAVTLQVYQKGTTAVAFGEFATPAHGSTVQSSIPITGWVLDDIEVAQVKIYNGLDHIGDAVLVEGARPDVEQAYPDYPRNYQAGWGYMMLTNFLPNGGNGTYTIYAKAIDAEGNQVTLGSKTITCDNANAVKPFGALDTPGQGGTASGSGFINWGWVLTPQPNSIPTNGSTINVYIDGVNLGHPTYNVPRSDIANFFPGYANSSNAAGYFLIDTTVYANGIHTIQWVASDDAGNKDGIGSRFFNVLNINSDTTNNPATTLNLQNSNISNFHELSPSAIIPYGPVKVKKGYNIHTRNSDFYPDHNGNIIIEIKELERVVIRLGDIPDLSNGYLVSNTVLRPLPPGSTLDTTGGLFYWQPGLAFLGNYRLVFVNANGKLLRRINIKIRPKY